MAASKAISLWSAGISSPRCDRAHVDLAGDGGGDERGAVLLQLRDGCLDSRHQLRQTGATFLHEADQTILLCDRWKHHEQVANIVQVETNLGAALQEHRELTLANSRMEAQCQPTSLRKALPRPRKCCVLIHVRFTEPARHKAHGPNVGSDRHQNVPGPDASSLALTPCRWVHVLNARQVEVHGLTVEIRDADERGPLVRVELGPSP